MESGFKHGESNRNLTPEYISWRQMRRRCNSPNCDAYQHYGGRGIKICKRWQDSYLNFLSDMGRRPRGTSLGRIDNDGDYCPDNCRWETRLQQQNNTRSNTKLSLNGISKNVGQWESALGLSHGVIWHRLKSGWPLERALTP